MVTRVYGSPASGHCEILVCLVILLVSQRISLRVYASPAGCMRLLMFYMFGGGGLGGVAGGEAKANAKAEAKTKAKTKKLQLRLTLTLRLTLRL